MCGCVQDQWLGGQGGFFSSVINLFPQTEWKNGIISFLPRCDLVKPPECSPRTLRFTPTGVEEHSDKTIFFLHFYSRIVLMLFLSLYLPEYATHGFFSGNRSTQYSVRGVAQYRVRETPGAVSMKTDESPLLLV